jgi:hypothetical protein
LESSTNNLPGDGFGFSFCFSVSQPLALKCSGSLNLDSQLVDRFWF